MCALSLLTALALHPALAAPDAVPAVDTAVASSPFTLLEGQEVARTVPLRDVRWQVYGHSADGARILAGNEEGPAILDIRGDPQLTPRCSLQRESAPPPHQPPRVVDVSAARDGTGYSASFTDGEVCTWDAEGNLQSIRRGTSAATLADAKTLVLGFADGRLEGRNPRTGGRRWARNPELGAITHMRMERDGPRVAASTGSLGVSIIDSRYGRLVRALRGPPAWSAAFSPTGDRIAVGRANGRVELWDTKHWVSKDTVRFSAGTVIDVDWSVDGTQISAATERGSGATRVVTLEVYDVALDELVFREVAPEGPGPTRFRFDHSGDRVIVGNGPGAGRVWSKPGARQMPRPLPSDEPPHQRPFADLPALPDTAVATPVTTLTAPRAASPNGRLWLHEVGFLATIPSRPGREPAPPPAPTVSLVLTDIDAHTDRPLTGSANTTGPYLVSDGGRVIALVDGRVQVWGPDGSLLARIGIDEPQAVTVLGERILLATKDGKLYAGTAERIKAVPNVTGATVAAFDPAHPNLLAVGGVDGSVRVVDLRGTTQRAAALHSGPVRALAFSDDGHLLASAGPGATSRSDEAPSGVIIVRDQNDAEAAPWRAVVDSPPDRLDFTGERLFAFGQNAVHILESQGITLELSANVVAAGFAPQGVRWSDPHGAIRLAVPADKVLPSVPRGRTFATSPDARWSVSVDGDIVSVWDDKSGKLIRELPSTGQAVLDTVFSDAGDRVAVLAQDRAIEVFDVTTGEALRNIPGPAVESGAWMRFDETGEKLWTFAGPREIVAIDIATGNVAERVSVPGSLALGAVSDRAFSRFVSLTGASGVEAWVDVSSRSPRRLTVAADGFRPVAVDPKGERIAAIAGGNLERRDAKSGRRVGPELVVENDAAAGAADWSHNGAYIAVSYASGLVRIWDLERNRVVASLGADARQIGRTISPVASLSFDAADEIITTRDADGHPRLFEWNLSMEAPQVGRGAGPVLPERDIRALVVSTDGRTLYSAHGDSNGRAWNLANGVQTQFFWGHGGAITALWFGTNGRLVTGSADGTVRTWEASTGIEKSAHNTFGDPVRQLSASSDGWRIAAVGDGKVLRTWDIGKGKALRRWSTMGELTQLLMGPDGATLLAQAAAWWRLDPSTGAVEPSGPPGPLPGGAPEVSAYAEALGPISASIWTPDRKTWVSAHADGRIRIWDVEQNALRMTLLALTDGSWVVDRPDGSRYASESLRDGSSPLLYRPPPR